MASQEEESFQNFFTESLTLGLVKLLEETPGVQGVEMTRYNPCDRMVLTSWEQRYNCTLPKDLKNFYFASDGFKLIWNYEYSGEVLPIGNMKISKVSELRRIGGFKPQEDADVLTPLDVEMCQRQRTNFRHPVPNIGSKCKLFELDGCQGLGKVCLVYQQPHPRKDIMPGDPSLVEQPTIWLLDRCFDWHFIADDFTTYFRMMLVHKGLPQWQFKFTPIGLTPWAEQFFALLAPHFLQSAAQDTANNWDSTCNLLDPAIFKIKSKQSKTEHKQQGSN
ncbi:tubulin polyglutamylase complex subunit 2 [Cloeon dipterum]|uniref:tubulin polyglutamylase complex subunit 2 n=1 Tax=Cloeon dipterum TaxID=197152 RepID=UPI00322090C9